MTVGKRLTTAELVQRCEDLEVEKEDLLYRVEILEAKLNEAMNTKVEIAYLQPYIDWQDDNTSEVYLQWLERKYVEFTKYGKPLPDGVIDFGYVANLLKGIADISQELKDETQKIQLQTFLVGLSQYLNVQLKKACSPQKARQILDTFFIRYSKFPEIEAAYHKMLGSYTTDFIGGIARLAVEFMGIHIQAVEVLRKKVEPTQVKKSCKHLDQTAKIVYSEIDYSEPN